MEVGGYYRKKETLLEAKDKIMLTLLSLSGSPNTVKKSTYIKGVSLNCSFTYVEIVNEMGLKDNYINTGRHRTMYLEFPLKDKKDLPQLEYNDLLECLVIDPKTSTAIRRNIHLVTRKITKNLLLDYFVKEGVSNHIIDLFGLYTTKQLYKGFIKDTLIKLLETYQKSLDEKTVKEIWAARHKFMLDGGYTNYKKFFEVGTPFREARGAIDLYGARAFEEIKENPYKLLKVHGISFKKADIRAIVSFKEDMWGIRRASVAFLSTIKHIIERGRYEAGSTAVSIKQIQYYGHLYMIGREGAKTAHSYIEDIMSQRGQTSRWNMIKSEEGKITILKLLFKGAGELKEQDTEYLLTRGGIPMEVVEKALERLNQDRYKENPLTYEEYTEHESVFDLVVDDIVMQKIEKGETVIKYPTAKRVSTLGDFLLETYTLSNVSKIIMRKPRENQTEMLKAVFNDVKSSLKNPLTNMQESAINSFVNNNFSILTGGPGTGKTFTVSVIVDIAKKAGLTFKLLAPTGKAAKRMSDLADNEPAQTIHMLLGFKGGSFFEVQCLDPYDFVIIDECSMVDPILFGKFLSAVHSNTRVLLVGDPDQLPSIRAGNLLGDLIRISDVYENVYGMNLVTKLTEIMRQKKIDGEYPAIVKLSQDLMRAAKTQNHSVFLTDINDSLEGDINFPDTTLLVAKSSTDEAEEKKQILKVFRQLLAENGFDCDTQHFNCSANLNKLQDKEFFEGFNKGKWQIITPFRRAGGGKLASDLLNPIAREYINKESYNEMERWSEEMINRFGERNKWKYKTSNMFAIGDKVLCTANIYKPTIMGMKANDLIEVSKKLNFPVVNGDIGIIEEIYTPEETSNFGIQISQTMEEIPEIYRSEQFLKVYGPFYKIAFEGKEGYTWFNSYDAEKLSLGYVFTVHKSQGSEYDNLMTIITSRAKNFVTPKMLYTAMTRAKKKLFLVISQTVLEEILLLAQKDERFTVINQLTDLSGAIPFGEKNLRDYPEEFKALMRVYLNWMVIIRNRFNKINNIVISPYDFILKVMHSNIVGIDDEEEEDTDE